MQEVLARLGNVIYWAGLLGAFYAGLFAVDSRVPDMLFLSGVAVVIVLGVVVARYVLSGYLGFKVFAPPRDK